MFRLIPLVLVLSLAELAARIPFAYDWRGFETTRRIMRGEQVSMDNFQHVTSQPYLLYVPTPLYANEFGQQNNEHGYRGRLIPLERTEGVSRILCMGGSTTYGFGVDRPSDVWPAQLEALLNYEWPE